jgi:hypothetical protein
MFASYLAAFELPKAAATPPVLEETCIVNRQFKLNHFFNVSVYYK